MIIGIAGKKGSGKTTFAEYLAQEFGTAYITSFATPLYQILSVLDGRTVANLKAAKDSDTWVGGSTVRNALQQLGTEVFRAFDPDIWVKTLDIRTTPHGITIIDDVRFLNEAQYVKERGTLIRINRPGTHSDTHDSETALDGYYDWDLQVENDKTLAHLQDEARIFVSYLYR